MNNDIVTHSFGFVASSPLRRMKPAFELSVATPYNVSAVEDSSPALVPEAIATNKLPAYVDLVIIEQPLRRKSNRTPPYNHSPDTHSQAASYKLGVIRNRAIAENLIKP